MPNNHPVRLDLREEDRKPYSTSVTIILRAPESDADSGSFVFLIGDSRNISTGGLCFTCPHPITDKTVLLHLRLPEDDFALIEAEVISSREVDGGWEYGATFCRRPETANIAAR